MTIRYCSQERDATVGRYTEQSILSRIIHRWLCATGNTESINMLQCFYIYDGRLKVANKAVNRRGKIQKVRQFILHGWPDHKKQYQRRLLPTTR